MKNWLKHVQMCVPDEWHHHSSSIFELSGLNGHAIKLQPDCSSSHKRVCACACVRVCLHAGWCDTVLPAGGDMHKCFNYINQWRQGRCLTWRETSIPRRVCTCTCHCFHIHLMLTDNVKNFHILNCQSKTHWTLFNSHYVIKIEAVFERRFSACKI